jgi:hypothetical protein
MRLSTLTLTPIVLLQACGTSTSDSSVTPADASSEAGTGGFAGASGSGATGGAVEVQFPCLSDAGVTAVPGAQCASVIPGSFGDCTTPLGIGFDGEFCVPITGCAATEGTLFESVAECAVTCASTGECNQLGAQLKDEHCDDITIGVTAFDESKLATVCSIAPEARCYQQPEKPSECKLNTEHGPGLTPEQVLDLCALSLVPDINDLHCWVYL